MITRSLHLRTVLGTAFGVALAFAAGTASAQGGTAPAPAPAPTTPTTAPTTTPASEEDPNKKKTTPATTPTDTAPPPATAPAAAPATAPAAAPATTSTDSSATVTFGSGPKKDEPSKGAIKPAEAAPPVPWYRGSMMIFDQSATVNSFSKGSQLSYQPVYEWWISPRVNYNFSKQVRVTLRQDLFKEWTNVGETTERGEWRYTDTWLSLAFRPSLASISKNLSGGVGFQLRPGVSKESRIAGQYFTAGPLVNVAYNIDLAGEKAKLFKSMHLSSALIYTYAFSRCNTPCAGSGWSQPRMNADGQPIDDRQVRTASTVGNQLVYTANVGLDIAEHFDFSASMIWISQFAKGLSDASFGGQPIEAGPNETRVRQWSWFFTQFSYGVAKEITVAAGYWNLNNVLHTDGRYRNPFWSPEARVFFDIYFHFDAIYERLRGTDAKKGGGGGGGGSRVF